MTDAQSDTGHGNSVVVGREHVKILNCWGGMPIFEILPIGHDYDTFGYLLGWLIYPSRNSLSNPMQNKPRVELTLNPLRFLELDQDRVSGAGVIRLRDNDEQNIFTVTGPHESDNALLSLNNVLFEALCAMLSRDPDKIVDVADLNLIDSCFWIVWPSPGWQPYKPILFKFREEDLEKEKCRYLTWLLEMRNEAVIRRLDGLNGRTKSALKSSMRFK